jgi:biotin carboxyl carrier protein
MKLKILLLAVLALITFKLEARTPRVKNKSFTYQTIKLPEMALPVNRTYSLYLETAADYGNLALRFQNVLQIPGWSKTANGEYAVDVKLFPVDYQRPFIIERRKFIRDTAGVIVDTLRFFRNVYKARGFGSLQIMNHLDQSIYSNNLREVRLNTTGREFRSKRAARKHRMREASRLQQEMAENFAQQLSAQANRRLDALLGIYNVHKRSSLMIVRNKKHKEFRLMNNFWSRFVKVADQVNANSNLNEIEEMLFNEITYLRNIENKYRGNKKSERKMRYMAYNNLSAIYTMLEMPQKSMFYAQKIRNNSFRKYNAGSMIAKAQNMKRLHDIHKP